MSSRENPRPVTQHCVLSASEVYEEILNIRPIHAPGQLHDFLIRSRLDIAKNPNACFTRHRLCIDREGLERLHAYLGDYLTSLSDSSRAAKTLGGT